MKGNQIRFSPNFLAMPTCFTTSCAQLQLPSWTSYIRKEKYRPATTSTSTTPTTPSHSGYPPWILKQGGLDSFGQRLISSIGKTKRMAFFF